MESRKQVLVVVRHKSQWKMVKDGIATNKAFCPENDVRPTRLPMPLAVVNGQNEKMTVVVQSYSLQRKQALDAALSAYSGEAFRHIIDSIILVWNNPDEDPPQVAQLVC